MGAQLYTFQDFTWQYERLILGCTKKKKWKPAVGTLREEA